MIDIAYNIRMIGWVQEPRNCLPLHPPPSRPTFLSKTILKSIINNTTINFTSSVFALSPAFDARSHGPTDGPETYLTAVPLLRRVPYILAHGITLAATVGVIHNITASVCVGLGFSSPTLWSNIWGHWGDPYTVREIWGRVLRRPFHSPIQ